MNSRRTIATLVFAAGLVAGSGLASASGGTITGKVSSTPAKYLKDTVVYVKKVPGSFASKTKTEDQQGMKFSPHILTITAGDKVKFLNHDHVSHNVMSPDGGFNLGMWGFNGSKTKTFAKTGTFTLLCGVHPEMLGYVFVGQNPYSAAVRKNGSFTIRNVPPGTYEIDVWNSHLKASSQKVTVKAGGKSKLTFALHR